MGSYNLPRNVKGEGKILFIFSTKAFLFTGVGGGIGILFYWIFSLMKLKMVGLVIALVLAFIGFAIGTFKVPDVQGLEIGRKAGGESLDDVIIRYIKFKKNNKKLYVYTKEEKANGK